MEEDEEVLRKCRKNKGIDINTYRSCFTGDTDLYLFYSAANTW